MPLYETRDVAGNGEVWISALTQGMEPEVAAEVAHAMRAARAEHAARPVLSDRQRRMCRNAASPRALALRVRLRMLPRDAWVLAAAVFPMSVPDRARLAAELRELIG